MLPPVTRKVHSPHASFSKASGKARQISRSRFSAGLESSYMRGCAMDLLTQFQFLPLYVAIHQMSPAEPFTPPTRPSHVAEVATGALVEIKATARIPADAPGRMLRNQYG